MAIIWSWNSGNNLKLYSNIKEQVVIQYITTTNISNRQKNKKREEKGQRRKSQRKRSKKKRYDGKKNKHGYIHMYYVLSDMTFTGPSYRPLNLLPLAIHKQRNKMEFYRFILSTGFFQHSEIILQGYHNTINKGWGSFTLADNDIAGVCPHSKPNFHLNQWPSNLLWSENTNEVVVERK